MSVIIIKLCGGIAQLARVLGSYPIGRWFEPNYRYQTQKGTRPSASSFFILLCFISPTLPLPRKKLPRTQKIYSKTVAFCSDLCYTI